MVPRIITYWPWCRCSSSAVRNTAKGRHWEINQNASDQEINRELSMEKAKSQRQVPSREQRTRQSIVRNKAKIRIKTLYAQ